MDELYPLWHFENRVKAVVNLLVTLSTCGCSAVVLSLAMLLPKVSMLLDYMGRNVIDTKKFSHTVLSLYIPVRACARGFPQMCPPGKPDASHSIPSSFSPKF